MAREQKPYKSRLSERDITILMELYQLQAIRARDLDDVHFRGKQYGFQRLQRVCDKGYIERVFTVRDTGQRYQSVYSITDKGVEELLKLGKISQERRARDLRLETWEMLQRIEVSKIAITLEQAGWTVMGSRDAKPMLGLPYNSIMQCYLEAPRPDEDKYRVYVMGRTIKENTLTKLYADLLEDKNESLILYKAENVWEKTPAYRDFIKKISEEHIMPKQICLIPLVEIEDETTGKKTNIAIHAMLYGGQAQLENSLRESYGRIKYSDNRYHFGNLKVDDGGEEKFVCNYLRRDRAALKRLVENFTLDEYQKTGNGVIVVTWEDFVDEVREAIDSVQSRSFIEVQGVEI